MARKCSSPGCAFTLPDKYPLEKCPWHLAPGKGPVKIAAAITIAAAGFGGGIAYKKFRAYLRDRNKPGRKKPGATERATTAASKGSASKSQTRPRARKKTTAKSKKTAKAESAT